MRPVMSYPSGKSTVDPNSVMKKRPKLESLTLRCDEEHTTYNFISKIAIRGTAYNHVTIFLALV